MRQLVLAAILLFLAMPEAAVAFPVESGREQVSRQWPHQGLFIRFDRPALRRGFQVYREVCASCHSLGLVAYRDLTGIGYTLDEAKGIAERNMVKTGAGEAGKMILRPARLSDRLAAPFSDNRLARAANNGLLPPDLSQIVKAHENGEDYLYWVLNGSDAQRILEESAVTYAGGSAATGNQMAADVVTFLAWASEPALEERRRLGLLWMLFFAVLTAYLYYLNRRIWAKLD